MDVDTLICGAKSSFYNSLSRHVRDPSYNVCSKRFCFTGTYNSEPSSPTTTVLFTTIPDIKEMMSSTLQRETKNKLSLLLTTRFERLILLKFKSLEL